MSERGLREPPACKQPKQLPGPGRWRAVARLGASRGGAEGINWLRHCMHSRTGIGKCHLHRMTCSAAPLLGTLCGWRGAQGRTHRGAAWCFRHVCAPQTRAYAPRTRTGRKPRCCAPSVASFLPDAGRQPARQHLEAARDDLLVDRRQHVDLLARIHLQCRRYRRYRQYRLIAGYRGGDTTTQGHLADPSTHGHCERRTRMGTLHRFGARRGRRPMQLHTQTPAPAPAPRRTAPCAARQQPKTLPPPPPHPRARARAPASAPRRASLCTACGRAA